MSPSPQSRVSMRGIYFAGIIGARLAAVLTDMIVLAITIWKARPVRIQGVKLGVKSTMVNILMRDGMYEAIAKDFPR